MTKNLPDRAAPSKKERAARVGVALAALATAKGYKFDDLSITVYARVVEDVPVPFIEAACRALEKQSGEWMPKASTVRDEAILLWQQHRRKTIEAGAATTPRPYCRHCLDTGFARTGERRVKPCACRSTNPHYLLKRTEPRG